MVYRIMAQTHGRPSQIFVHTNFRLPGCRLHSISVGNSTLETCRGQMFYDAVYSGGGTVSAMGGAMCLDPSSCIDGVVARG